MVVAVVETGGVGAAADRLNIAKSAISWRLAELESRLGAQLFARTTRQVTPTEAGRAFYDRAVRILADVDEAEQMVGRAGGELVGSIRLSAPTSFGLTTLAPHLIAFQCRHPRIRLDIDLDDRRVDLIEEGIDLALRIGELQDSSLIARRLLPIDSIVCASPDYLDRHGRPKHPQELLDHVLLGYGNIAQPDRLAYHAPDGSRGAVRVPLRMTATNGDMLREAAIAGLGVVREPRFIFGPALADGRLEQILPEYDWGLVNLHAVYPPTRHLSVRVRALIDFLADRLTRPSENTTDT